MVAPVKCRTNVTYTNIHRHQQRESGVSRSSLHPSTRQWCAAVPLAPTRRKQKFIGHFHHLCCDNDRRCCRCYVPVPSLCFVSHRRFRYLRIIYLLGCALGNDLKRIFSVSSIVARTSTEKSQFRQGLKESLFLSTTCSVTCPSYCGVRVPGRANFQPSIVFAQNQGRERGWYDFALDGIASHKKRRDN